MDSKQAAVILRLLKSFANPDGDISNITESLEMGAEALELLAYLALDPNRVRQIASTDECFDGKWGYVHAPTGKFISRSADGGPLEFMDALRAAKEAAK